MVGCAGSYPGPDSAGSCYLLEADQDGRTWRILLDLGSGALGPLHRYADPLGVDAVFLSHLHADHCLDLCGYYVLRRYHPRGVQPRIPVWGPDGTAARLAAAYGGSEGSEMAAVFGFAGYSGPVRLGPFTVDPVPVVHPVPAYALRVSADGGLVAYTGDTGPCPGLARVAAGADLLLAEASFEDGRDNPPDLHLTGGEAGRLAAEHGVPRLVLTHIPPWNDPQQAFGEARASYRGSLDLAVPGAVYEV